MGFENYKTTKQLHKMTCFFKWLIKKDKRPRYIYREYKQQQQN